ncbi:hypothetical protein SERLA73DRAFT_73492 [Serpula lacrymans var. lacrymans S7.3]|uniref:Uncharacterized protein n=2 Tax=Serpula lacrymans var. lacrymans TaxID=341189 RepID=F8PYE4_SERL3|nr:uncharacterized protein SERLADRAFT_438114 [Serpula lacrymans var. lacrymans S7.9]EGN98907.1 hypothetical protein SERLA73DRAFT_73492 [Serpula lacrymans var. lacrymans S7.3]EGO24499.1 hypothetical protein SERLADRAFT_438114 [Serpula lacrymans var. lacrymans S7.9]
MPKVFWLSPTITLYTHQSWTYTYQRCEPYVHISKIDLPAIQLDEVSPPTANTTTFLPTTHEGYQSTQPSQAGPQPNTIPSYETATRPAPVIDPSLKLQTLDSASPATNLPSPSDMNSFETPRTFPSLATVKVESTDDIALTSQSSRARVSNKNSVFGFVEGAQQGIQDWRRSPKLVRKMFYSVNGLIDILHQAHLHPPLPSSKDAASRFLRCMADIVGRAEHMSVKTNSWLVLAGQHPTAQAQFIHYTSPRLRCNAFDDVNDLISRFSNIIAGPIQA